MSFNSPHQPGSELWCEALSRFIEDAVDRDSIAEYREPEPGRWHLGASEIGHECSRRIWYSFRWALKQEHTGAQHRLFQRGHTEEDKFVNRLRRIGIQVWDRDPNSGQQFKMIHADCPHYGGSLDALSFNVALPKAYHYAVGEFKTHNDASFAKLLKDGVRKSKPQHFRQMSCYGHSYKIAMGLYCAVNKNNDELHFEFVRLDWKIGEIMLAKAREIIAANKPPTRISENSADFRCKFCPYRGPCHLHAPLLKNCRSCLNCTPNATDKEWTCARFGGPIPRDVVATGCDMWSPIA